MQARKTRQRISSKPSRNAGTIIVMEEPIVPRENASPKRPTALGRATHPANSFTHVCIFARKTTQVVEPGVSLHQSLKRTLPLRTIRHALSKSVMNMEKTHQTDVWQSPIFNARRKPQNAAMELARRNPTVLYLQPRAWVNAPLRQTQFASSTVCTTRRLQTWKKPESCKNVYGKSVLSIVPNARPT